MLAKQVVMRTLKATVMALVNHRRNSIAAASDDDCTANDSYEFAYQPDAPFPNLN